MLVFINCIFFGIVVNKCQKIENVVSLILFYEHVKNIIRDWRLYLNLKCKIIRKQIFFYDYI